MKTKEIKIKPISFSELLAGKVADGSKTMTRRLTDIGLDGNRYDVAEWVVDLRFGDYVRLCTKDVSGKVIAAAPIKPKFQVGQILYVREGWRVDVQYDTPSGSAHIPDNAEIEYLSYPKNGNVTAFHPRNAGRKRLPRFMPARFARTFLRVTAVRCERLQDITEADAVAEGVLRLETDKGLRWKDYEGRYQGNDGYLTARHSFASLWDSINKKGPKFADNPWVWVVSFERVEMPNPWNSQTVKP